MTRMLVAAAILTTTLAAGVAPAPAADALEPFFLFEGVIPMAYQTLGPVDPGLFTEDGRPLTGEELQEVVDLREGDRVVLIRGGEVVGEGALARVVAEKRDDASRGRVLYATLTSLPEGVAAPGRPDGAAAFADRGYDLLVVTDLPVEVLARDPELEAMRWGVHDYVVRVGRVRYAVSRENDPRRDGFRGWQIMRLGEDRNARMSADYTWWAP
ncbi:hypothetical protein GF314_14770 [bacterium]|nr:hypothetical protein [bacterium]